MDKTALVDGDIAEGRRLVTALERAGLPIAVAMWFRKASSDNWMLGIASPDVQVHGPLSVIRFAEHIRSRIAESSVPRDAMSYFNTSKQFFSDIGAIPGDLDDRVLTIENISLNGTEIEKAFVFHIRRNARPSHRPPDRSGADGDAARTRVA